MTQRSVSTDERVEIGTSSSISHEISTIQRRNGRINRLSKHAAHQVHVTKKTKSEAVVAAAFASSRDVTVTPRTEKPNFDEDARFSRSTLALASVSHAKLLN